MSQTHMPLQIKRRPLAILWLVAVVVAAATFVFGVSLAPREHVGAFLALYFASAVVLGAAAWWAREALAALPVRRLVMHLVALGALLRVAALVAPVSLSDDVHRYVWDGAMVLDGKNPYLWRPGEVVDTHRFGRELFDALNSPGNHTVYPPLTQAVFAAAVATANVAPLSPERCLRLFFVLFDLASIALLVVALVALGRAPPLATLYALNPFVYWEFAAGGHTEVVAIPFLLLMILAAVRRRGVWLGVVIGLGALAKPTLLVAAPVLGWFVLRSGPGGWRATLTAAAVSVATIVAGYAPLWAPGVLENHRESFELYAYTFSFNSPVFYGARHWLGYREGVTDPIDHLVVPWLNAATVALLAAATLLQNGRVGRLAPGLTLAMGAHLLLSPTFHPWYLAPILVVAILARSYAFVLLSLLVALTYLYYLPDIGLREQAIVMAVQFIPFVLMLLPAPAHAALERILRNRGRWKFGFAAPHLAPNSRVLDIGAGEGFVGLAARGAGHEVELVDVVDRNRTGLPFTVYDGHTLPFGDASFDVGILSYVLHHCPDPDRVVAEAARVCRRLVILESTYVAQWDRRLLTFLDHNANRLRGMGKEPLHFDTPDGWRARFATLGLEVRHFEWLGRGVHKHVLFVLE